MAKNAGVTTSKISFCDLQCGHADFARMDALDGSCRTFQSLWCKRLKKHVTKTLLAKFRSAKDDRLPGFSKATSY